MPNSTYTPGPWRTHAELTDRDSFVRHCRVVASAPSGDIMRIASTDIDNVNIEAEERKANARLVAAAPEMLMFIMSQLSKFDKESYLKAKRIIEKATL